MSTSMSDTGVNQERPIPSTDGEASMTESHQVTISQERLQLPKKMPTTSAADDNFNPRQKDSATARHPQTNDARDSMNNNDDDDDDGDDDQIADPREEQQRALFHKRQRKHRINEASPFWGRTQSSIADYISKSPLLKGGTSPLFSSPFLWGKGSQMTSIREHQAGQNVLLLREDHVSLDQLNPHPSCRTRKSSTLSAMINLVATVCGGGVLSLPLAFSRAGVIPTTMLMLYGAIVTDFSLVCLVDAARKTGGRTYGDVAAAAFGSVSQVVTTLTIGLMLCGTMIAYQVLVRDIWTPVVFFLLQQIVGKDESAMNGDADDAPNNVEVSTESANILLACILFIAMPLLWKKDLYALRHTCYVGFGSCVLLMLAVVYRAYEKFATVPTSLPSAVVTTSDVVTSVWEDAHAVNAKESLNSTSSALGEALNVTTQPMEQSANTISVKWWADDPTDVIFAFPIVVLCFFCSYNVLGVHSQLVNPTRDRIRFVLGLSMFICWSLFFVVGLCGYLYTAGGYTPDNILLAFELQDKAILAGRMGFCLTLLFGLPLVMLPTRDALTSLPEQIRAWRRDADLIAQYKKLNSAYQDTHNDVSTTESMRSLVHTQPTERTALQQRVPANDAEAVPHLVINGVDFDGTEPKLISRKPELRHGTAILYGSTDPVRRSRGVPGTQRAASALSSKGGTNLSPAEGDDLQPTNRSRHQDETVDSQSSLPKVNSATVTTTSASVSATIATASVGEEHHEDDMMMPEEFTFEQHKGIQIHDGVGSAEGILDCPSWWDSICHGGATLAILAVTYGVAITVPGVASVWSIVGSSMAIWIAFVVPTGCFLKIRQHKGLTMQALYAWIVLAISLVSMVVCTKQAVYNAFHSSSA